MRSRLILAGLAKHSIAFKTLKHPGGLRAKMDRLGGEAHFQGGDMLDALAPHGLSPVLEHSLTHTGAHARPANVRAAEPFLSNTS